MFVKLFLDEENYFPSQLTLFQKTLKDKEFAIKIGLRTIIICLQSDMNIKVVIWAMWFE